MPQTIDEHNLLLPAIREAGRAVMRYFTAHDYEVKHKDAENPVTDADFAVNRILRAALEKYFQGDAILSEESETAEERTRMEERLKKPRVWIIDPIDGTRAFIEGHPSFAISVGLIENGVPVLGFVHNPARNYLLSGGTAIGLFMNGEKFTPPPRKKSHPPKIVVSRSEYEHGHLAHLEKMYDNLGELSMSSIAYKLALVADGTYDLTVSVKPKNEWDVAGGAALLRAAHLTFYDGAFDEFIFNKEDTESWGIVAGTPDACAWYQSIARGE